MCSLSKEEFLARAPPFMGDILWAHLEILQKEVENKNEVVGRSANVESGGSFSEASFTQPTYTNLDQTTTSAAAVAAASSASVTTSVAGMPRYTTAPPPLTRAMPPQQQVVSSTYGGEYNSTAGSTVDTSSEYSYGGMAEVKYSQQQQQQQQQMSRVPTYPPPPAPQQQQQHYNDQFGDWSYVPPVTQPDSWHQPPDFNPNVVTSSSLGGAPMHHHPAFTQVGLHN